MSESTNGPDGILPCEHGTQRRKCRVCHLESELADAIHERDAARASLAEARRVIEPFLRWPIEKYLPNIDGITVNVKVTAPEYKAAAAFLAKNQPDEREKLNVG